MSPHLHLRNFHIEFSCDRLISSIFICQQIRFISIASFIFLAHSPQWQHYEFSNVNYSSEVPFDDENKYFFAFNEMLIMLPTPSIRFSFWRPSFLALCLFSVILFSTTEYEICYPSPSYPQLKWKINKIKGKSFAFRQRKKRTRKSNKDL